MGAMSMNRREAMASLLAVSAAGALVACSGGADGGDVSQGNNDLRYAAPTAFFSSAEMTLIGALCNTIIPDTDSGGAVAAGVPTVLQDLATLWGDDDYRRFWRAGLRDLDAKLSDVTNGGFAGLSEAARNDRLSAYDAKVFESQVEDNFYKAFKSTVVQAYYMSEIGASEELAYEPVPGDWKGCVPLSDYPKTWAT